RSPPLLPRSRGIDFRQALRPGRRRLRHLPDRFDPRCADHRVARRHRGDEPRGRVDVEGRRPLPRSGRDGTGARGLASTRAIARLIACAGQQKLYPRGSTLSRAKTSQESRMNYPPNAPPPGGYGGPPPGGYGPPPGGYGPPPGGYGAPPGPPGMMGGGMMGGPMQPAAPYGIDP